MNFGISKSLFVLYSSACHEGQYHLLRSSILYRYSVRPKDGKKKINVVAVVAADRIREQNPRETILRLPESSTLLLDIRSLLCTNPNQCWPCPYPPLLWIPYLQGRPVPTTAARGAGGRGSGLGIVVSPVWISRSPWND